MLKLIAQGLRNLAYFKTADFKFTPGITCVLGVNKNARTQGASNGSGKSSAFIPMHSTLGYDAPLIKGRQGARDLFGRTSEAYSEFKRGKHKYRIHRKGSKYTVFRDGVDLGLRTQPLALARIQKLRGLTDAQFYSTVYLDSSKAHAIQSGTSSERMHFFTDLFDLHDIDTVRKYCASLMTDASDAASELSRLKSEIQAISVVDTDAEEAEYQNLVKIQDRYQRLLRTNVSILHLLDLWDADAKARKEVAVLKAFVGKFTLKGVKRDLLAHREYAEASAAHREWSKQQQKLVSEIRDLQQTVGKLSLQEAREKLEEQTKLQGLSKPAKPSVKRDTKALSSLARALGSKPSSKHLKSLEKRQAQLQGRVRELQTTHDELASHVEEDEHGKCPMCLSKLKPRHFETLAGEIAASIRKTRRNLDTIKSYLQALQAELEWTEYEREAKVYEAAHAGAQPDSIRVLRRYVQSMQTLKRLRDEAPEQPKTQPPSLDIETLEARQRQLLKLQTLQERPGLPEDAESTLRQFCQTNGGLPFDSAVIRTFITDNQEKFTARLQKANACIPKLRSKIDMLNADAKRARQLRRKMIGLRDSARDLPILKMLVEAYAKSGIKSLLIKRLAKQIEKNLNQLAPRVLHEPMSFQLMVDGANFHVLATRKNMGKPLTSDVRTLSGAERRMFILLFLLATLPMLPAAKRYDTLILDEPDANLDPPNLQMLRDRLLPRLLKVVPKIVVLSPNPQIVPQGARVVTAVKHNNVTVLNDQTETNVGTVVGRRPVATRKAVSRRQAAH